MNYKHSAELYREHFGARVQLPKPGPERNKLRSKIRYVCSNKPMCDVPELLLRMLEKMGEKQFVARAERGQGRG